MPGNLINSQVAAANFFNPYGQYGVNMGVGSGAGSGINWLSLASELGGSAVGAGGVIGAVAMQNYFNRKYYEDYQSPEARMAQMRDAGINPYAAAQGIAGGAAPSVAPPQISQDSFRSIGEQLGGSVNNALAASVLREQIDETKSKVRVNDATARSLGVDTDFNLATFDDRAQALKNQNQLTEYQIEQLRPYAEHADEWYKINFDELDQRVKESKKRVDEINEQIRNLKKQRELWNSEIGVNESTIRYNDSVADLNNRKKQIIDELGGEDVEQAYIVARVKGENNKAEAIKDGVKTYNKSASEGQNEGNPLTVEQKNIIASYDERIAKAEEYLDYCEKEYYSANSFEKPWKKGTMDAAAANLKTIREEKAEQLRRLGINESTSYKAGSIGVSKSK